MQTTDAVSTQREAFASINLRRVSTQTYLGKMTFENLELIISESFKANYRVMIFNHKENVERSEIHRKVLLKRQRSLLKLVLGEIRIDDLLPDIWVWWKC